VVLVLMAVIVVIPALLMREAVVALELLELAVPEVLVVMVDLEDKIQF
jgi:hypothetical protein